MDPNEDTFNNMGEHETFYVPRSNLSKHQISEFDWY